MMGFNSSVLLGVAHVLVCAFHPKSPFFVIVGVAYFGKLCVIIFNNVIMTRSVKITALWLLTICGFSCHSICDVLPMFWGCDMAVVATDGNVDQSMIVFMMVLSFLVPACGVYCMLWKDKALSVINAVLAVLMALFNIAHAAMELPAETAGQYVILPAMIAVGLVLAWHSIKYVRES